jgi:hypothetical protein
MGNTFGCINNTIKLRSGVYFDLADPDPATIKLPDIAGALSRICRFGGHCWRFYSVAEHSVLCARQARDDGLPNDAVRAVLLHDAAEAFVGDMVQPLKIMMPEYRGVEDRVEAAVAVAFKVDFKRWSTEIKGIDHAMLMAERRRMFESDSVMWTGEETARRISPHIECRDPESAEALFVSMFDSCRDEQQKAST